MKKVEERHQKMLELVAAWQQSGLTQKDFATQQNIKLFTFRYWIQKHHQLQAQQPNGSFVELSPVTSAGMIIRYGNGTSLELPANTPINLIRQLIQL